MGSVRLGRPVYCAPDHCQVDLGSHCATVLPRGLPPPFLRRGSSSVALCHCAAVPRIRGCYRLEFFLFALRSIPKVLGTPPPSAAVKGIFVGGPTPRPASPMHDHPLDSPGSSATLRSGTGGTAVGRPIPRDSRSPEGDLRWSRLCENSPHFRGVGRSCLSEPALVGRIRAVTRPGIPMGDE